MLRFDRRGFTLIELLVVMALLGGILAAGWNLYFLGQKAWDNFQVRQEAEAATRYTSQIITNQLKYAASLDIHGQNADWSNNDLSVGDRSIYLDNDGQLWMRVKSSASTVVNTQMTHLDKCILDLSFSKQKVTKNNVSTDLDNVLSFTVTAKDKQGNVIYTMPSAIMLSNMLPGLSIQLVGTATSGQRIRYNTSIDRNDTTGGAAFTTNGCW